MRYLIAIAMLVVVTPVCIAQSVPASRLKNVSAPAMRFIGLATATQGGNSSASPLPNARQTLAGITIVLNIPYSFENPEPQLKRAIIRCALLFRLNSAHIAEEQIVVPINGQPTSGTAPLTFAPVNNRNVSIAHAYTCQLELSDGRSTTFALGLRNPPWARSQAGSVLLVRGTFE